ncbi:hypothetical protein M3Y99_01054100 [Aphelenchoides fujianensis]|nr:hypothetical protein M3Y99_01054100 [Aphelenchoides fujianensis]
MRRLTLKRKSALVLSVLLFFVFLVFFDAFDDETQQVDYDFEVGAMETRLHALDGAADRLVRVPANSRRFLRNWANARFVECLNLRVQREGTKQKIPLSAWNEAVELRDLLDQNDVTMFLLGGTLLGEFHHSDCSTRLLQCGLIPHTRDLDFALHSSELTAGLVRKVEGKHRLKHKLGELEDSFELTTWLAGVQTDLFVVYPLNGTHSYTTVVDFGRRKRTLAAVYPRISGLCTGLLLGALVHVPCNVPEVLEADYGPNWREDRSSADYSYLKAPNLAPFLEHTDEEFEQRMTILCRCFWFVCW